MKWYAAHARGLLPVPRAGVRDQATGRKGKPPAYTAPPWERLLRESRARLDLGSMAGPEETESAGDLIGITGDERINFG